MRLRVVVILCAAAGLGVSHSFADAADFLPRAWENGAFLEIFGSYESDDNDRPNQPFGWHDTFLREKVTLYSNGYVYHPRFLQYQASLAGALKQEDYGATYLDSLGWTHDTGVEYDGRLLFLAEKPYNLELFALRYEPLLKEQASTQHDSVETSRGAFFQYRKKPWLFHSKYSLDSIDSGVVSTDITRLGVDGEYFKRYTNGNQLSFTGAYNPSESETSQGLDTDQTQKLLANLIDLKWLRLNSSVTRNDFNQESERSGRFSSDQRGWYELMNVYFPYHLRSDVSYRQQGNDSTYPDPSSEVERELTDDNEDFRIDVFYRLYESLDVIRTYQHNARMSSQDSATSFSTGETIWESNSWTLNYAKTIPRGRLLAGTNVGRGQTRNKGIVFITDEPHRGAIVNGEFRFTLNQQNLVAGTIEVAVRTIVDPIQQALLIETIHYSKMIVGSSVEILVTDLPVGFPVDPAIQYDFLVSYSLPPGEFELDTDIFGFNTSVELLDTLLTPYYSYVEIRSDLVSGVFPGTPLDSTTNTAGVRYLRGPVRARVEFQDLDWEISPYRAWRGEFQYIGSIDPTTNIYGTAQYVNRHFPRGTSPGQPEEYTDETASVTGNLRKEIPSQGLSFSVGGSISKTLGRVDTNAWSINSSLNWQVGKLIVTAGANAYSSDSEGLATVQNDRFHQYYYVTLRRDF